MSALASISSLSSELLVRIGAVVWQLLWRYVRRLLRRLQYWRLLMPWYSKTMFSQAHVCWISCWEVCMFTDVPASKIPWSELYEDVSEGLMFWFKFHVCRMELYVWIKGVVMCLTLTHCLLSPNQITAWAADVRACDETCKLQPLWDVRVGSVSMMCCSIVMLCWGLGLLTMFVK